MFALTILGNNSAVPAYGRNPTSQLLQTSESSYLIDCGEGTQMQINKYKIKTNKLKHIFISHLHGDHYFGLIGLVTSMGLMGRKNDLHIYAPETLEKIINIQLEVAAAELPYKIYFHHLKEEGIIANDKKIIVEAFKVNHRIECWGFVFREIKIKRTILPDKIKAYEVPLSFLEKLHEGENYITSKGTIINNEDLTIAAPAAKVYAYCADTIYDENLCAKVQGVDLLYHEATYMHEFEIKAAERFHSTTVQAGKFAKKAAVKKLLIGHFSSKYENLEELLKETRQEFDNTELAIEGVCFRI